ncbi:MAG: TrkA C-terminal domain-containing protein, partial [Anaerolineales bacterium]
HRAHQVRLDATTQTDVIVVEIPIENGALCAGKQVSEVQWPHGCILSSVQRGRRVFVPRGDTVLQTGDILVAVTESEIDQELLQLCKKRRNHDAGSE